MASIDSELQAEFQSLISCFPCTYYSQGICPSPNLFILENHAYQPIQFPINPESLTRMKNISTKSMFGYKTTTKYDKNVRHSYELNHDQFELDNFALDSRESLFLEQIRKDLMHHLDYIIAKPHKLIIYEEGCFFSSHKDSKASPLHFGSLVVMLPFHSLHQGGEFILSKNKNTQYLWKPNPKTSHKQCQYISFYTDTNHEVCKIKQGVRITITFQLLINEKYFHDFNKYNHIILNNSYHENMFQTSKKPRNTIKKNKKTGLYKIKKIRGITLDPRYAVYDVKLCKVLIGICNELNILSADICSIIAQYVNENLIQTIKARIDKACGGDIWKLKHVNSTVEPYQQHADPYDRRRRRHDLTPVAFFVMFEHKYSGNVLHPCMLKGRDIYVYKYFQRYMFVHTTPLQMIYTVGRQSYLIDDTGRTNSNGETWQINREWSKNDKRCKVDIEIGHRYGEKMDFVNDDIYIPKYVMFMEDEDDTLQYIGHKTESEMNHYIGNCGDYALYDCYHCCGLYMTPFFPCKSTDELTSIL
eukprot:584421_1